MKSSKPEKIKYCYGYVRVSLKELNEENQKIAIRSFAQLKGWKIKKFFTDVGVSGAIPPWERPGFKELLTTVEKEPLPVLIYELSRLGRTFYETLRALQDLESKNAPVIAVSEKESFLQNLDPSVRKLIIAIFSWVAEREREVLIQRTKEGMMRAKLQGVHIGRPRKEINMKEVEKLLKKGVSKSAIAKILGVSYATLYRKLKEVQKG